MKVAIEINKIAEWETTLNHWKWPDDLPGKPTNWDNLPRYLKLNSPKRGTVITRYDIARPLMKLFKYLIGDKECLRWHHIHNLGRTNEEFEGWFDSEDRITFTSKGEEST